MGRLYFVCSGTALEFLRRRYAMAAHSISAHVTMPTPHAAIHVPFHRFWMIGPSAVAGSGRSKKKASLAVQPEAATATRPSAADVSRMRRRRSTRATLAHEGSPHGEGHPAGVTSLP
jgi:hypothetical protein